MAYVEFRDVGKTYHMGEVEITALHDATFSIEKGELVVIVGPSGAGKTTLLNILGGMDTLSRGQVFLDGREISKMNCKQLTDYRREDVGFVFQFYNLIGNLTALENVELANQICRDPLDAAKVLQDVGLGGRMRNFPSQLSGGEQQRVAIARALVNNPSTIIADEPTGNLDPERSMELMDLLVQINELDVTVLVVTHEKDLVDHFGKRVVTIENGQVVNDSVGGYVGGQIHG